ncbi:M61 family metallopeptidase [Frateuria terrea]|uniref:Predicted metalloprotease, contains C-terminal PDZ domain n=1 Tax=Frateuria terrea TaxID=529704 RepID=A0A1H6QK29_9GAMM|nr:M61 family metallopeptidase [Frateuria terrea]SEI44079.1 Predicted metalloprotease, contains C-terminal PDZ domain [Frateuria terrea]SFP09531.1 Predicted metalloprotease, contains C-terminal PDZ domain [Frateuria terrea]
MSRVLSAGSPVAMPGRMSRLACAVSMAFAATAAVAQQSHRADVPPPQDTAYPGTVAIHVDASDTTQGIFRVHETLPVTAGALTLLYPKWIPGDHSPSGPVAMLAGLKVSVHGKPLKWTRDKYDVYAFHLDVPAGVSTVDVDFQYLSSRDGGYEMTDRMLDLEWNKVALYPAGHFSRDITFAPSVTLPHGWQFGSALETVSRSGDATTFKPVSFNTLVDSPIYAGRYFKRVDLTPAGDASVHLDIVADAPKYLEMTPEQVKVHRALASQAVKLFGSHHYDHYDFLFSLSDQLGGNGLEHHQSSEDGLGADYFTAWADAAPGRDLLAHEYVHSWNGKFRRPADLWTPNFNVPMGDSLLWVYEGQTQYWGFVLTARSGMWSPEEFRDALAMVAANYDRNREGFQWRTLEDTTNDPTAAHRSGLPYRSWQMSEEYYSAGQMVWLEVDAKLRALTHDRKSLDDFARAFFGVDNGSFVTRTYTFDDVVAALNGVAPYDWAGFLRAHVDTLDPPLLGGLEGTGWKLVYTDQPSAYEKQYDSRPESPRHLFNFSWSIGMTMFEDGQINDVRWDGPAFKAGVSTGATIVAVNGKDYSKDVLKDAIAAAKGGKEPIKLLLKFQGGYRTVPVDYHGGLQYPHLVRVEGRPDYLSQIIAPRR